MNSLRADFSRIEIVHTEALEWVASPMPGVWRKRLELYGPAEAGRVTSVVRYDPGSRFRAHPHPDGEEILVLEGVFSDERGDHPAGTWLANPEGFSHAPSSAPGCTLFVKLRQYAGPDRPQITVNTHRATWMDSPVRGVMTLLLYQQDGYPERVQLTRIAAGARVPPRVFPGGAEIFAVEGAFSDERGQHGEGAWLRFPAGAGHTPASESGCLLYEKRGHLPQTPS